MNITNEEWKFIDGYADRYEVSNRGRIRSWYDSSGNKRDRPFYRKIRKTHGYNYIMLSIGGDRSYKRVHRLVAKAFIPNPQNKSQINHINGIKTDNRVENLEWASASENSQHSHDNKLQVMSGKDHPQSKLSENDILDIRNAYNLGCFTHKEIANAYDLSRRHVGNIINRNTWSHI